MVNPESELRSRIDGYAAAEDWQAAMLELRELWIREPSMTTASFIASRYRILRKGLVLVPHRLAILRSFTVEPLVLLLQAGAFTSGIDLDVHAGEFNAYAQEIRKHADGAMDRSLCFLWG